MKGCTDRRSSLSSAVRSAKSKVHPKKNTTGMRGLVRTPARLPGLSWCDARGGLAVPGRVTRCSLSSRRTWPGGRRAGRGDRSCGWGEASWWRALFVARRLADDGRKGGIKAHQDEERTRPLSPSVEGSMAGHETFTDTLFASEDPSCSPPKAFGGEMQGPVFSSTSGTRSSPSQGETERVSLVGGRRSSSGVGHPLE